MSTTKRVLEAELSEDNFHWIITVEFTHHPCWLRRTFLGAKETRNVVRYFGNCTVWNHYPSFVPVHNYDMEFYLCSVWTRANYKRKLEKKVIKDDEL